MGRNIKNIIEELPLERQEKIQARSDEYCRHLSPIEIEALIQNKQDTNAKVKQILNNKENLATKILDRLRMYIKNVSIQSTH